MFVEIFSNFVRSSCRADASELDSMVLKILVSSANVVIFEFVTTSGRWFSYKRNNKGPRIDPCGTPDVTGTGREPDYDRVYQAFMFVSKSTNGKKISAQTNKFEKVKRITKTIVEQRKLVLSSLQREMEKNCFP